MSRRQQQHMGRSEGDERKIPGRDFAGDEDAGTDALRAVDAAREISRRIDENDGFGRASESPRATSGRGRAARSGGRTRNDRS
jgi:hypothetical protein